MREGLKVEGGDKLGKTIIFARNSKHAKAIVEAFSETFQRKAVILSNRLITASKSPNI